MFVVIAALLRLHGLIETSILYVECGPYYWVVSWGSDIVTIGKGRKKQEMEGGKSRRGGGSENYTFTGGFRAIMQYCSKVYWMCLTINNQFIGTWWRDKRCTCYFNCFPFIPLGWPCVTCGSLFCLGREFLLFWVFRQQLLMFFLCFLFQPMNHYITFRANNRQVYQPE